MEREGTVEGFQPSNPLIPVVGNRVVIDVVAQENADVLERSLERLGLALRSNTGLTWKTQWGILGGSK